ncbi:MAG: hypothetical protein ACRCV7_04430 [Culicoidibacterales bacterium]
MKKYRFKYTKEEKIHYVNVSYENNNADQTIVIFQSVGIEAYNKEMFYKYKLGLVSYGEYKYFVDNVHGKYQFFKEFGTVNKIFVEDNFNMCFGWYLYNNKVRIDDLVARAINQVFIEEKIEETTVSFYGNSKGAYGAALVGQYFPNLNRVILTYPIVRPIKRYQRYASNESMFIQYHFLMRGSAQTSLFTTAVLEALKKQEKRVEMLLGLIDDDTEYLLSYMKENNFTLKQCYLNLKRQNHGEYSVSVKGIPTHIFENEQLPEYIVPIDVKVGVSDDL